LCVKYIIAKVIAPSPISLGLISRRGVRTGIGISINTGFKEAILNHVSEQQYDHRCFQMHALDPGQPSETSERLSEA